MNRRKKIIKKLQKKDKKANAKLHKSSKPAYVSKAEREKLAEQAVGEHPIIEQATTTSKVATSIYRKSESKKRQSLNKPFE